MRDTIQVAVEPMLQPGIFTYSIVGRSVRMVASGGRVDGVEEDTLYTCVYKFPVPDAPAEESRVAKFNRVMKTMSNFSF